MYFMPNNIANISFAKRQNVYLLIIIITLFQPGLRINDSSVCKYVTPAGMLVVCHAILTGLV